MSRVGLLEALWPASRLHEAVARLARASGLVVDERLLPPAPNDVEEPARQRVWMEHVTEWLGLEAVPIECSYNEADTMLATIAPGVVVVDGPDGPGFLALLRARGRTVTALAPDGRSRRLSIAEVSAALRAPLEAAHNEVGAEALLAAAGVRPDRRARVRAALLAQRLGQELLAACWMLRLPASGDVRSLLRSEGVPRRLALYIGASLMQALVLVAAWQTIGEAALGAEPMMSSLWRWALLIATMLALDLYAGWTAGSLALDIGALLKVRLLTGATRLDQDRLRLTGIGQFMAMSAEAASFEALVLSGGLQALLGALSLLVAAVVLYASLGLLPVALLLLCAGVLAVMVRRYYGRRKDWTVQRGLLTHGLVEQFVGHRTFLVQVDQARWQGEVDSSLARYLASSQALDRMGGALQALAVRGWPLVGGAALIGTFYLGADTAQLAAGVGGLLLAGSAMQQLAGGLSSLSAAAVAAGQIQPLFQAAAHTPSRPSPRDTLDWPAVTGATHTSATANARSLVASGLRYRYPGRSEQVLDGCSLTIHPGEHILIEGPSGGGKSTLGAVLATLRPCQSGLLLLGGVDPNTVAVESWRKRVVAVPQFHENHIFSASLAFNILMGAEWPPKRPEMVAIDTLCRELGLGPLLERMPAWLQQMVGESGWQLSHGERSRIYMARALAQRADIMILDESFAAMDPSTMRKVLRFVLSRSSAVVLIAHP